MDKEQQAIERLRFAANMSEKYYGKPLVVTTSGGKDSSVCVQLALNAGIDFELMHNHTTADAPETVRFIRAEFKRLEDMGFPSNQLTVNMPYYKGRRISMWSLIPQMLMPPTRLVRYCCAVLKEQGGVGRYITTGVRWAESVRRKANRGIYETVEASRKDSAILNSDNDDKRQIYETCALRRKAICNPIVDWTDNDVWQYIRSEHIPVNPLYEYGFSRVGCIGCPMAGKHGRERQFLKWPKYKNMYKEAFEKMLEARREKDLKTRSWDSADDVFHWWMNDGVLNGQMDLFGDN